MNGDGGGELAEDDDWFWRFCSLSVEKYPNNQMLGRREIVNGKPGEYIWMTYKVVYDIVLKVGASIRSCGIDEVDEEFEGVELEIMLYLQKKGGMRGLTAMADHSAKEKDELLKTLHGAAKYLKTIVSFGKVTSQQKEEVEKFGVAIYSWHEFLSLGENRHFNLPVKKKTDICTIMYTSGTTGDPKGVMISNNSIVTLIAGVDHLLGSVNQSLTVNDVYLSYLPLAHIFDRVIEEGFISHGASIGFWRGDVKLLVEDLGELKPTIFFAVPRIKQGLGGNVRIILSGAAPLASHVEEFLRVVSCSVVLQGYGLTETCAGTFISIPDELNMLGTVGPPVPNVDVCLESVPEMGYDALSRTPRGEICIRGNVLFSGYYKREDLTKEVLTDGWFHTGDIGEWQPNGSMKIIDRKKNIFKLSQGEYVAVENLENIYGIVSDIDSIWVYGNSFESFLIAIINPNQKAVEQWAEENGISVDFNALCENPKVKEHFLGELTKVAKEKKLKGFEFIKALHLDAVPFDMERDLITPTFKKKRPQLLKYYQGIIDNLYKSAK
ncbi:hypothetical protein RD792_001508 [Penstemon davidsonii]|uniref:AMP-dependent synthetase/ligase domain-containing protein n=1 Tax=Penstemon davidsonii TaxID=160366 RepID=A0ABR0DPC8_9LAMI|nr:hypothetical protein RD792_001508 [Penstemon davidsonii]